VFEKNGRRWKSLARGNHRAMPGTMKHYGFVQVWDRVVKRICALKEKRGCGPYVPKGGGEEKKNAVFLRFVGNRAGHARESENTTLG